MNLHHDRPTQSLKCLHCHEQVEIPRRCLRDPEGFARFAETVADEHSECSQYTDVRMAQQNRLFRKRMKTEMAKLKIA